MTKLITFKAATKEGPTEKTGYKVRLMVGNTHHVFVLQNDLDRPSVLTDWRSGYKLANLGGLALARYPYSFRDSLPGYRRIAQDWVNALVRDKGEAHVLAMLAKPETLNA